jgi:hypothetical protein
MPKLNRSCFFVCKARPAKSTGEGEPGFLLPTSIQKFMTATESQKYALGTAKRPWLVVAFNHCWGLIRVTGSFSTKADAVEAAAMANTAMEATHWLDFADGTIDPYFKKGA